VKTASSITALVIAVAILLAGSISFAGGETTAPSDPHEHIKKILERDPYNYWKLRRERTFEYPDMSFAAEILNAFKDTIKSIVDFLDKWLTKLDPPDIPTVDFDPPGYEVADIVILLGWVALALLLSYMAVMVYRRILEVRRESGETKILSREKVREALEAGEALAMESPEWIKEAERLAAIGEFRAVFRAMYLALLSGLHSAGKIDFRKNRTNWVYVNSFHGPLEEKDIFSKLTGIFDNVWYGRKDYREFSLSDLRKRVAKLLNGEANDG